MRYESFTALLSDPAIALIGPVSLDPDRFEFFQRIVGINSSDD